MTYDQILKKAVQRLEEAGIEEAASDAKALLFYLQRWQVTEFLLNKDETVPKDSEEAYGKLIESRRLRIPLQHLTQEAWFFGYPFKVNAQVLIPRLDTEVLVEKVLSENKDPEAEVLDLCTGSGCIAVTLKKEGHFGEVTGSDISPEALAVAKENAEALLADVTFIESDLFENITKKYDIIVSNPPYIADGVIKTLSPEVKDHDPYLALSGGEDGLMFYRKIVSEAPAHLESPGRLYLEIGDEQGEAVSTLLQDAGFTDIIVYKDLAGFDRVVRGYYV